MGPFHTLCPLVEPLTNPMCGFSDGQLGEPKRLVAYLMIEQESYGVTEDFSQQPAGKVPEIPGPHPLHGVTCCELRKNGVDAVAKAAQVGAFLRGRISFLGGVWGKKFYAYATHQLLAGLGRVVVAVPDDQPRGFF